MNKFLGIFNSLIFVKINMYPNVKLYLEVHGVMYMQSQHSNNLIAVVQSSKINKCHNCTFAIFNLYSSSGGLFLPYFILLYSVAMNTSTPPMPILFKK